jgi:hypothetical protein
MMAENYSFHFLNKEGQLIMIVSLRCADDQAAMAAMPEHGPWADIEICTGEGRIFKPANANPGRKIQRPREPHPDH